jgi:cellulose biosynthesis protein BcsQ
MRVVAVAGAKGGVGKTAAAVNLAMLSAASGYRTLLWDLDPFVRSTDYLRLDLLPADPSLRVVDTILSTRRWPERVVRKLVRPLDRAYDVVFLDCAPGLGVVTESVVAASDLVLAPIIPAPLAVRSLDQLEEFVSAHRPGLPVLAFLSMLDERKVLHRQIVDQVRADRRFGLAAVPVSAAVERMGLEQVPAVVASPRNLAATAYRRLWAEAEERLGDRPHRDAHPRHGPVGRRQPPDAWAATAAALARTSSASARYRSSTGRSSSGAKCSSSS